MSDYTITVEVNRDIPVRSPLQWLTNTVASELERLGLREGDYEVVTSGPPELSIGVVYDD